MKEKPLLTTDNSIYVRVAVPAPVCKYFDYLPPEGGAFNHLLQPGIRVQVPFGRQILIGIVVEIISVTTVPFNSLKPIIKIIDLTPLLPILLHKLLLWASQYYQYPLGLVFDAAFTSSLRGGSVLEDYKQTYWQLTALPPITEKTTSKQQQLLKLLTEHPAGIAEDSLNKQGFNKAIRNRLVEKNLLKATLQSIYQPSVTKHHLTQNNALELNPAQLAALTTIKAFNSFQTFLLDGVTGSGKTEVYLQAIANVLQQNKQVLILIPEINLTPQTLAQFEQRFTTQVVVFHSKISDKKKTDAWFKAKLGLAPIILGTRSAAFIPLKSPGLFIIDEEHDQSFKQQEGFRYSARDLLIKRAQLENCPIILGSATPSLESLYNAKRKRYCQLKLPERTGNAISPKMEILDIRHKKLKHGLSLQLLAQIEAHLKTQGQVLLFLNRRGYAPVLMCGSCNWTKNCNHCDARMILHFNPKPMLICHHCQTNCVLPAICPACGNQKLAPVGFGTAKLEQVLKTQFPAANIVRVDKDTTSKKDAMQNIIKQVISGQANILIGTQMLAKGHHFPNLSLVAIIDIDGALFSSDFRTIERMGQLITQVAGRAGRAELPGHVILQTQHPEHPLLQKLLTQGYHALCESLLEERNLIKLPPFSYQILFKAASKKPKAALDFLAWLKNNTKQTNKEVELLGPIPSPIEKKASYFRAQLLIQSTKRYLAHSFCEILMAKIESYPKIKQILWSVDVDPLDFY